MELLYSREVTVPPTHYHGGLPSTGIVYLFLELVLRYVGQGLDGSEHETLRMVTPCVASQIMRSSSLLHQPGECREGHLAIFGFSINGQI